MPAAIWGRLVGVIVGVSGGSGVADGIGVLEVVTVGNRVGDGPGVEVTAEVGNGVNVLGKVRVAVSIPATNIVAAGAERVGITLSGG